MISMKIGWLMLFVIFMIAAFYSGSALALSLALLLIILPLCSLLMNLLVRNKIEVSLKASVNLRKGQQGDVSLTFENSSVLPVLCIKVNITFENQLNRETDQMILYTWLPPKGKKEIIVSVGSSYCGRIRIDVQEIGLYDCFGLIPIPCRCKKTVYTTVQPDTFEINLSLIPGQNSIEDSDTYSQERPGSDMTETFQIREYVPGDSPRQIHWKLTNKFDKLIVRDPALPITRNVLVFWERSGESGDFNKIDAQAETIVSVGKALLEQSIQFTIGWNDTDRNVCILHEISDMDQLTGVIPRLMRATGAKETVSGADLLLTTRADVLCGHMIYLAEEAQPELMEMKKYGRVTSLLCGGTEVEDSVLFDADHYRDQLSHIEV